MKRGLAVFLIVMLFIGLVGCSVRDEDTSNSIVDNTINPLSEKQYEALIIDESVDFGDFFNSLNQEYSDLVLKLYDYVEKHSAEIENHDRGFSDFFDYADSLNDFYRFLNGVIYCDSKSIPEEYKEAWSYYQTMASLTKDDLDGLYFLKGQDLISGLSNMLTALEKRAELVARAIPGSNWYSDLEIFAAKFCMAYMNHLKNPYSFTVKSIWAYASPVGGYDVYVKFTAENSFGGTGVMEITNTIPIYNSDLESIARTDEILSSLSIYVSEGQNPSNDGINGEWLDASRIQSYIDDNYV